ncbi:MAG TPA: hypothetical protein VHH15_05495 [Actinophytocola sp.]|nr:hypothetical protein [Actinophytocola sp.]
MAKTVPKMLAARRATPHGDATWLVVTVNATPDVVTADQRLSDAVADLGTAVETRLTPAPGGRGTEIAARVQRTGTAGAPSANDLRLVLRQVKSQIETGEVVRPDPPTTGRRTPGGALVRAATRRAGGEGRL